MNTRIIVLMVILILVFSSILYFNAKHQNTWIDSDTTKNHNKEKLIEKVKNWTPKVP